MTELDRLKVLSALKLGYGKLTAKNTTEKEFENIEQAIEIVEKLTLNDVSCDCDKKIKDLVNWVKSDLAEESSEKVGKWSTPYREEKIRFLNKLLEIGKL